MSEHDGPPGSGAQRPPGAEPPQDAEAPEPPEVGSLGEEAAKLLGALGSWARDREDPAPTPDDAPREDSDQARDEAPAASPGDPSWGASLSALAGSAATFAAEVNAHIATGQAECRFCPVCRTVHAVRQTSPEVRTQLRAATTHALQAALAFMSTLPPPDPATRRGPDVERIDLEPDQPDQPDQPDPHENPEDPR